MNARKQTGNLRKQKKEVQTNKGKRLKDRGNSKPRGQRTKHGKGKN